MARVYENKKAWWIDYVAADGVRHRRKISSSRRVATEALNATLAKIARKEWVGVSEDSKISFVDFSTYGAHACYQHCDRGPPT